MHKALYKRDIIIIIRFNILIFKILMHKAFYKRDIIIINVSLIFCCRVNKVAMVSFILGQGADINKEFENGDRFEIIFNGFN